MELTNKKYIDQLAILKQSMLDAESFARKLPIFSEEILYRRLLENTDWQEVASKYKSLPCNWGINRSKYTSGGRRTITNCRKQYDGYFFNIYINTLNLYDSHEKYGLYDIATQIPVFFYDKANSTFYATDDEIEALLEALVVWYENAIALIKKKDSLERVAELKKELQILEGSQE